MMCRKAENEKTWYRSDRYFKANGQWYFTTREKSDIGPFGSVNDARQGLQLYIKTMQADTLCERAAIKIAQNGTWAETLYH